MDYDVAVRPPTRTALIASELSHYNRDIAAISEAGLADEWVVEETGSGYTFSWKGKSPEWKQNPWSGICHQVKPLEADPYPYPTSINERLLKIHRPIGNKCFITIISAGL